MEQFELGEDQKERINLGYCLAFINLFSRGKLEYCLIMSKDTMSRHCSDIECSYFNRSRLFQDQLNVLLFLGLPRSEL